MKLINPSFEILEQAPGIQGIKQQIERAGRTCYKSEDKITDTSCEEFVSRMVNSGHGAMLEHGTVYLMVSNQVDDFESIYENFEQNKYSQTNYDGSYLYVTTNYRVLVENGWLYALDYQCEPTVLHEKRITVKFICDRGVSHEFVRHRVFSFAQESTRYCNYSKDKFGNEVTFIIPNWVNHIEYDKYYGVPYNNACAIVRPLENNTEALAYYYYFYALRYAEDHYFKLLSLGWTPQQARTVLPNSLKTELIMSGFISDWKHFFKLRCNSTAHPQARELAVPLKEEFIKKGYLNG